MWEGLEGREGNYLKNNLKSYSLSDHRQGRAGQSSQNIET